jgi:hypothetical protein
LVDFLQCLEVPTVATFHDSALYTRLADEGSGIFDAAVSPTTAREVHEWTRLLHWIDTVADHHGDAGQTGRHAAAPHNRAAESAEA